MSLRTLTPQELRVVDALLENGASNRELAARFRISEETVKRHLSNIMDKLGFGTRLELAVNLLHQRYAAAATTEARP